MVSEFGQVLLKMLDEKDMSCYELGEASALGAGTISKLVNGKRPANERHALRILIPLLADLDDLDDLNDLVSLADGDIFTRPRRRKRP